MRRVNAEGRYDFFWAKVENGHPALVLKIGSIDEIDINLPKLKNLKVRVMTVGEKAIVISLIDVSQRELFETLCRDIVGAGEAAPHLEAAVQRVIRRTYRWLFLLKGGSQNGMSIEAQRGLVAELAFLRELMQRTSAMTAIEGWMGPTGAPKDFEFPRFCAEIKARRGAAKSFVSISSADQLSDIDGARLFLRVYNIDSAIMPEGMTLHDHVLSAQSYLEEYPDGIDRFISQLESLGYNSEHEYENRRWLVGSHITFEVADGFPRIVSPLITGVNHVSYSIDLQECENFETNIDPVTLI